MVLGATSKEFLRNSADLALGFAENCLDSQYPEKFDRVRKAAVNALKQMTKSLPADERRVIATRLRRLEATPTVSPSLAVVIDNAVTEIEKIQGP